MDGRSIHYRSWKSPGSAQIVLVHGGAANGAWWDHIAPGISQSGEVHAIDLGGHGQSDWATDYTLDKWAVEVSTVIDHVSSPNGPTVVIGHSRGGFLGLMASQLCKADIAGVVMIESAFGVDPPPAPSAHSAAGRPAVSPPTRDQMLARFQPRPFDVPSLDYVVRHIGEQSIVEFDGHWRWQFDRAFLGRVDAMRIDDVRPTNAATLQVRGSHGLLTAETAEAVRTGLGTPSEIVVIEDAGHHIMLQKPRELTMVLQSTIMSWLSAPQPPTQGGRRRG